MKEINRLRLKFICYNMLIVTAFIGITFCAVAFVPEQKVTAQRQTVLSNVAGKDGIALPCEGNAASLTGYITALADTSYESSPRNGAMKYGGLFCTAVWIGFLVLSYFFSKWAAKPVEQSIRMQKQFVTDASHELKTPLTVITANAGLLQGQYTGISSEADKWLEHIAEECKEMRFLVETLLLLAKNDACTPKKGTFHLFSLSDLVMEKVLTFEPVFYQEEKQLEYHIDETVRMVGDQEQMGRLIRELLDNAVKYSRSKGRTEVTLEPYGRKWAKLWVNSQGEPIPKDKRSLIFRRFYRGDVTRNSGSGLGLAIAAEAAEKHGAKIGVKCTDGMNCFYVAVKRK